MRDQCAGSDKEDSKMPWLAIQTASNLPRSTGPLLWLMGSSDSRSEKPVWGSLNSGLRRVAFHDGYRNPHRNPVRPDAGAQRHAARSCQTAERERANDCRTHIESDEYSLGDCRSGAVICTACGGQPADPKFLQACKPQPGRGYNQCPCDESSNAADRIHKQHDNGFPFGVGSLATSSQPRHHNTRSTVCEALVSNGTTQPDLPF
jgi:hypothetical protein